MRFLKLLLLIAATLSLGAFAFLYGFNAWRAGQVVVSRKGSEPFVATADGALPITFATEVWGWMILGAAVVLCGIAGIVKFIADAPEERRATLARLDAAPPRNHRGTDIPWSIALAIIGFIVAFFLYLGFRVHSQ
ncbi:hypothetical protein [Variovorax boronicumulans]|uniref:hypothetical protein n=1 Tax=Variovorax boronicumulans TaxID=436515 RepID=UPI0024766382|nr:hypothetical protein [Variovorax boronicumulans]